NIRVLFSKTPYGDQAIFIKRKIFDSAGGYPQIPLMEEVELMKKIKKEYGGIKIIKTPVKSSARRWEQHGIFKTTARNYLIYLLHSIKVSPDLLAKIYYGCSR
ncbi:MAG: TIGR04283 family arsenosugar biosynthesis glycosyltransferase, partial [Elusimicrobiota bacterium]